MRDGIPYGAWPSPFGLDLLVQGRVGLSDVRFDGAGGAITWLESRPEEQGRQALVRWTRDGGAREQE